MNATMPVCAMTRVARVRMANVDIVAAIVSAEMADMMLSGAEEG